MTDEELATELRRAFATSPARSGHDWWVDVARRARELLAAPALPPEAAPDAEIEAACVSGDSTFLTDFARGVRWAEARMRAQPEPQTPRSGMTKAERKGLLWLLDYHNGHTLPYRLAAAIRKDTPDA